MHLHLMFDYALSLTIGPSTWPSIVSFPPTDIILHGFNLKSHLSHLKSFVLFIFGIYHPFSSN